MTFTATRHTRDMTLKRAFDIACAGPGLVVLAPVMALAAVAIKLDSPGPVLFRQKRIGRDGRLFEILKFRSMTHKTDAGGPKITVAGDLRVTRVGATLRKWKLDELPQLFNVVAGDMSIVGPRPEVPEFMRLYSDADRTVMTSVRPGVTDFASVLLRDEAEILARAVDPTETYRRELMPIKARLCALYIPRASVTQDLRIIFATLQTIVSGRPPAWLLAIAGAGVAKIAKSTAVVADASGRETAL